MVVSHIDWGAAPRRWSGSGASRRWCASLISRYLALPGSIRAEEEVLARGRRCAAILRRMCSAWVAAAAAEAAIERVHGNAHEFVLHFDVDVIADFQATNYPGTDGLGLDEVRAALEVFAKQQHLAAIEVCAYNPAKDTDGSGARLMVDLLAGILEKRLEFLKATGTAEPAPAEKASAAATVATIPEAASDGESAPAAIAPGEAWSSDALAAESESPEAAPETQDEPTAESPAESDDAHSE